MSQIVKHQFPRIDEEISYIHLENGLRLIIIPKHGFKETTCMLTSHFGSLDTTFTDSDGQVKKYPEGIAHFLEHKLFELANNKDAAILFTNLGADANAYTGFDKTSFFFSTTESISESLDLLQEFLSETHFDEDSIQKEKEIIGQEIDMYQDESDYRLYQGILSNLYPETPLAEDIAGTKESIQQITVEDLRENHRYFYHPRNMTLLVVGDIDEDLILQQVEKTQKRLKTVTVGPVTRKKLNTLPVLKTQSIRMDVAQPKLAVGYRGEEPTSDMSLLRQKIALRLLFAMLLGWTSETYQTWYEGGHIDDSFDIEIEVQPNFQFIIFSADTLEPIAMSNKIRQLIKKLDKSSDINKKHFELVKKELYGDFMRSLNSVNHLASQFMTYLTDTENYFDIPQILEHLSLTDTVEIGKQFLATAEVSDFTIFPK